MMNTQRRAEDCVGAWNNQSAQTDERTARQLNESEAVKLAREGNAAGFERIYRLHSKRVYGLCLRMLANTSEAEDLTQEVFLQVFRKIHTFRADSLLSTWLHRVTFNAVLMHFRKKTVLENYPQQLDLERGMEVRFDPAMGLGFVSAKGLLDRLNLERAVAKLPRTWKIVFILHDVHGFKHEEVARMLHFSLNTSKAHLHRAHLRLRQILLAGAVS